MTQTPNSQPTSVVRPPKRIKFNAIDRYYVIPETDDSTGPHFPMVEVIGLTFKQPAAPSQLQHALTRIEQRFPQFRLGYTLDAAHNAWVRVPNNQLAAHLLNLSPSGAAASAEIGALTGQAVCANLSPYTLPATFTLHDGGRRLITKMNHSLFDGKMMIRLVSYVALAMFDPQAFEALPNLPPVFNAPLWKYIWRKPGRGLRMLANCIRTFSSTYQEFGGQAKEQQATKPLETIHDGHPMHIALFNIAAQEVGKLHGLRQQLSETPKISMNTLLQVALMYRLMELGLQKARPMYTIPLDMGRFFGDPLFYGGNLAGQIRIQTSVRETPDFVAECLELQHVLELRMMRELPLATLPLEWLMALGGPRFYKRINRDWLIQGQASDPRFFVLSNVGTLTDFERIAAFLDLADGLPMAVSLMGGPPLVVIVGTLNKQLLVTMVYDPVRLSAGDIQAIRQAFSAEWLQKFIGQKRAI